MGRRGTYHGSFPKKVRYRGSKPGPKPKGGVNRINRMKRRRKGK